MSDQYIVSARKYRPQDFDSVLGQSVITNTLKNALRNQRIPQAFLFCGPRGVGKTTSARILARTLNCLNLSEELIPCGVCASCVGFENNASFNIHELDAASNNSVTDIRSLTEQVTFPPQVGKYSVYIIDEVHMLSTGAFNAFLKTLEEPPKHAIFILATTEKHKVLPTIISRCQVFNFKKIGLNDIVSNLKHIALEEGISYDDEALHIIAQKADGGMRDALSIFDQMVTFCSKNLTYASVIENLNVLDYDYYFKLVEGLVQNNYQQVLVLSTQILDKGFEAYTLIQGLMEHFRNLLVTKDLQTIPLLDVTENLKKQYLQQAQYTSFPFLLNGLNALNKCDLNYKTSFNTKLLLEITFLQIIQSNNAPIFATPLSTEQPIAVSVPVTSTPATTPISTPRPEPKAQVNSTPLPNKTETTAPSVLPQESIPLTTSKPKIKSIKINDVSTVEEKLEQQKQAQAPAPTQKNGNYELLVERNPLLDEFKQQLGLSSFN